MHDALLVRWRDKLLDGSSGDCGDQTTRRPGTYRVVLRMRRRAAAAGTHVVPAAAPTSAPGAPPTGGDGDPAEPVVDLWFDDPADFVAWVRVVELPRALRVLCGPPEACVPFPPAEVSLPAAGELRPLAEAALAAADEALRRPAVEAADAEAVMAAYNALTAGRGDVALSAIGTRDA